MMPSLEDFMESLTQEQNKLINMGKIKGKKVHTITMQYGIGNQYNKSKYKTKGKHMKIQRRKGTQNPSTMPPDPKVEREEKGRNALTAIKDSI
jgi:ribosomal protein L19E